MYKKLNETEICQIVTGTNKSWLTKTINQQKKYGNYNCIECVISRRDYMSDDYDIKFTLGESQGTFWKQKYGADKGKWIREYGNLYKEEQVTKVVNELAEKLGL